MRLKKDLGEGASQAEAVSVRTRLMEGEALRVAGGGFGNRVIFGGVASLTS